MDRELRFAVAYLGLYLEWRNSNLIAGALIFEPEPAKVNRALELVTRHCLNNLPRGGSAVRQNAGSCTLMQPSLVKERRAGR